MVKVQNVYIRYMKIICVLSILLVFCNFLGIGQNYLPIPSTHYNFDAVAETTPALGTTSGATLYFITGVNGYYKIPVRNQFQTTSFTLVDNLPATSTVVVQIWESIESGGGTTTDTDKYAIDDLTVSTWRYQNTTGNISLCVAVSSNSTLKIYGNDFLDITTLGVG